MTTDSQTSLATLSQGQKLEGRVKKVTLSGVLVDVGADLDGQLHISDMGQKQVTRVSTLFEEGQAVTVWVKRVDLSGGRLSLTMVEPAKLGWNDLKPGVKTEGKIVRLEKFGAFVDIGADTDGLVHISEMGPGRVGKPSDAVSEGDVVTVWVKEADRKTKRISLSMMEPPAVDIRDLKADTVLTGRVVRLETFGAFVDVGAGRDGMVHITEMGRGYVGSPADVVSVGEEIQVRVVEVDPRKGRISLSMKDLPMETIEPAGELEDIPSSMELALKAAMEYGYKSGPSRRRDEKRNRHARDRVQDDIIERTLRGTNG